MKFLRIGSLNQEKPAIIDKVGVVRDLSSVISDFNSNTINQQTIEKIKKLDVKVIVPGHGKVSSSLKEALKQQTDYFELLLNKIREAIAEGKFIDEAMESIDKENQLEWLLHEYQHARNVSRTYTELEWE